MGNTQGDTANKRAHGRPSPPLVTRLYEEAASSIRSQLPVTACATAAQKRFTASVVRHSHDLLTPSYSPSLPKKPQRSMDLTVSGNVSRGSLKSQLPTPSTELTRGDEDPLVGSVVGPLATAAAPTPPCDEYVDFHATLATHGCSIFASQAGADTKAQSNSAKAAEAVAAKVTTETRRDGESSSLSTPPTSPSGTFLIYGNPQNHMPFLEPEVLDIFVPMIMSSSSLSVCLATCPHWFMTLYSYLQNRVDRIIERFKTAYCKDPKLLDLEGSTFSVQPIFTANDSAVRVDLLLYCRVLSPCVQKCVQIGYTFSYLTTVGMLGARKNAGGHGTDRTDTDSQDEVADPFSSACAPNDEEATTNDMMDSGCSASQALVRPKEFSKRSELERVYQGLFRFETLKKGSRRTVWIHRDMCRFHGDELMVASLANVPTINLDDRLEIPVNISNAFGVVHTDALEWLVPESVPSPYREFGQTCELVRPQQQWYTLDAFQPTTNERLQLNDHFGPQWKHLSTEFTGIDITCSRSRYLAAQIGEVPQSRRWLGIECIVKPRQSPIVCPLTRLGLQHDRFSRHHVRESQKPFTVATQPIQSITWLRYDVISNTGNTLGFRITAFPHPKIMTIGHLAPPSDTAVDSCCGTDPSSSDAFSVFRRSQLNYLVKEAKVFPSPEAGEEFLRLYPQYLHCSFDTLYEDQDIVAVNKPCDVRVDVPVKGGREQRHWDTEITVADWYKNRYGSQCAKVWLCHQLDYATSGVLLLAKCQLAAKHVARSFEKRHCKKTYTAVVLGHVDKTRWHDSTVEFFVAPDSNHPFKMKVVSLEDNVSGAKKTTTKITVLEYGSRICPEDAQTLQCTRLSLEPITGRRHQLRLLTSHVMCHPILGDVTYSDQLGISNYYRLALHALKLSLPRPADGSSLTITSPNPFDDVCNWKPA